MFLQFLKCSFLFPGGWCHTKWPAEGKRDGTWKWSTMQIRDFSVYKVSDILPEEYLHKTRGNNPLDLMLQWYFCALCIIHLAYEEKKKKIACLLIFFFSPPHLNSLFYQYSVTGQFHFEHDRNAFPFCWKISAFQTVVIVWHSVVGGHVMVCVAQPLGLLVRTYKIVFIWARTFLLTIKQPSSYKMCQLILLRNKIK